MEEVERRGEGERNQFSSLTSTFGSNLSGDPWNPTQNMGSLSPSRPQTNEPRDNEQPQWAGPTFRSTQEDFRNRRQQSPRPPPTTQSTALIEHIRNIGVSVNAEHDDELSTEARSIIEDLIFQLRQRRDEVSHLQRRVEDLRKDALRCKRKDSEEPETRPTKRREVRQEEMVPSPIESMPTTASGTSDLRVQTTLMRIDDPPRPTPRL